MSKLVRFVGRRKNTDFSDEVVEKYDVNEFIVPARDTRGVSERFTFNLQPGHLRAMQVIANSQKFPFKDKSDVARFCIKVMLARLEEMEPVDCHTKQVDQIIAIVREAEFLQLFVGSFDEMARVVQTFHSAGDHGHARRLLAEMRAKLKSIGDDMWRRKYVKEFDRRFGHYLDGDEGPVKQKKRPRDDDD